MDDTLEQAKKKTDECQMALAYELESYILSRFRPSVSRLSGRFLATNRKAFHRKQMRLIVNDYFNKEEDDEPTMPLLSQQAAFPSQTLARNLDEYRELLTKKSDDFMTALFYELETYFQSRFRSSATGRGAQFFANQQSFHREQMLLLIDDFFDSEEDDLPAFPSTTVPLVNQLDVASNPVDTTPASPSVSPVTPSDPQKLVNSGEVEVKEKPIGEDSSTQPREIYNANTNENIVIVSITEQEQSDCEADSDCGCDDCMANKGRIHANPVMVDGSVAQMQTDAQQQATVPSAVNSNAEQVDNSVNSNFEDLNESQAMDFSDDVIVDEQAILDEAFVDETFPTDDIVSRPSTSSGRQSTRPKKNVNYANAQKDSDDEYSPVNHNRKRTIPRAGELSTSKRVALEPEVASDEEENYEEEVEEVGIEAATPLTVIMHHLNCPEAGCMEEYPDKAQLNGHLLSKHQISEFRCKVKDCASSFATPSELTDHRKLVHRKLKDYPCAQCETTCKSYEKLSNHFWRFHEEGEFHCSADRCDFARKTRLPVYNHQRNHSSVMYKCPFADCTVSFKQKSNLTAHQRIHAQERPFACEECNRAFTTKAHLTVHERIHSGLKPYICKWSGCDYSSKQRGTVYIHVRTVHFGLPASKKAQDEQNIIDTRNAGEFIEKNPTK